MQESSGDNPKHLVYVLLHPSNKRFPNLEAGKIWCDKNNQFPAIQELNAKTRKALREYLYRKNELTGEMEWVEVVLN